MRRGPASVLILETSPRDGLQNEPEVLSLDQKLEFLRLLEAAGPAFVEVTSFVRPDRVPQLADAEALVRALPRRSPDGPRRAGLVPNRRGFERFLDSGLEVLSLVCSVSEEHNRANLGHGTREVSEEQLGLVSEAASQGIPVRVALATSFGYRRPGDVEPGQVLDLARAYAEAGARWIVLADTIGFSTPGQVEELLDRALREFPAEALGLHLHDTYGTALAGSLAGWGRGVALFDTSAGGLGGCPFAPGAAGNLATEDLVRCFEAMGVATGVDLDALIRASAWMESCLGRPLPGRTYQALRKR